MNNRDIIVIGASSGGIAPLIEIVKSLPADLKAAIFVVVHIPPYPPSHLAQILSRAGKLKAIQPADGEKIEEGRIYVASPDQHLLVEDNYVVVKKGPKENRFRPSIDALFRSAAYIYGSRVIGIVLSGFLDDGTSGLWSVKRRGGVSIIQEPEEALFPDMPLNVLEYVDVDYTIKALDIGPLLIKLIGKEAPEIPEITEEEINRMKLEIMIARRREAFEEGLISLGQYTTLMCPDCNSALISIKEDKLIRFRCQKGHGFTFRSLCEEISKGVEDKLWDAMQGMESTTILFEKMEEHFKEIGKTETAEKFNKKADESRERGKLIHNLTFPQEIMSADIRNKK